MVRSSLQKAPVGVTIRRALRARVRRLCGTCSTITQACSLAGQPAIERHAKRRRGLLCDLLRLSRLLHRHVQHALRLAQQLRRALLGAQAGICCARRSPLLSIALRRRLLGHQPLVVDLLWFLAEIALSSSSAVGRLR